MLELAGLIILGILAQWVAWKLKKEAQKLLEEDHAKFTEVVDIELLGIHEGNFVNSKINKIRWRKRVQTYLI